MNILSQLKDQLGNLGVKTQECTPVVFDETKLTDKQWVDWKRRCAKHVGILITDQDEIILASRNIKLNKE